MTIFFLILIVLSSVILGFIILVQNPKGGGLAGNIAGFSNQFMGVKQTNDVLEKGTWIFVSLIALLCIFSTFFMTGVSGSNDNDILNKINTNQGTTAPKSTTPPATPQQTPTPPASNQP
ncbi:MAG: protein-export rane protein [Segetibacter sp.]|nr:protein-export rane protein [Segetibacter sp.]